MSEQEKEQEQEEQKLDEQYVTGFNNGYLLAKHEPKIAAQIAVTPNDHSDYFKGLISGKEQYDTEMREWAKSFSRGTPSKDERTKDLDR